MEVKFSPGFAKSVRRMIWWNILKPLNLKEHYRQIRWFFQRGKRGYADSDLWSLDWYLNSWMPQALRQFKEKTCGIPIGLSQKKWDSILDDMIAGFEANKAIQEAGYKNEEYDELIKKSEKGIKLFAKYYNCIWW